MINSVEEELADTLRARGYDPEVTEWYRILAPTFPPQHDLATRYVLTRLDAYNLMSVFEFLNNDCVSARRIELTRQIIPPRLLFQLKNMKDEKAFALLEFLFCTEVFFESLEDQNTAFPVVFEYFAFEIVLRHIPVVEGGLVETWLLANFESTLMPCMHKCNPEEPLNRLWFTYIRRARPSYEQFWTRTSTLQTLCQSLNLYLMEVGMGRYPPVFAEMFSHIALHNPNVVHPVEIENLFVLCVTKTAAEFAPYDLILERIIDEYGDKLRLGHERYSLLRTHMNIEQCIEWQRLLMDNVQNVPDQITADLIALIEEKRQQQ